MKFKSSIFLLWAIPSGLLVSQLVTPESIFERIAFVVACCPAGAYGLFAEEVTKVIRRTHPIQTCLYTGLLGGIPIAIATIAILCLGMTPELPNLNSESKSLTIFVTFFTTLILIPLAMAGSILSMVASLVISKYRNRLGYAT